jgi:hypothetical protein
MAPPSPPSHWRGGAGQAHRRWKMCDGWPAGPAPCRFYSTPAGTDPDPYPRLPLLGVASPSCYTTTLAAPSAKGRGRLIRCTVPGSTPNRSATPGLPGVARAFLMRSSSSQAIRGRPSRFRSWPAPGQHGLVLGSWRATWAGDPASPSRRARSERDAELRDGKSDSDEKRAAIAGGSKCETGRCQSPEDGSTPPLMV